PCQDRRERRPDHERTAPRLLTTLFYSLGGGLRPPSEPPPGRLRGASPAASSAGFARRPSTAGSGGATGLLLRQLRGTGGGGRRRTCSGPTRQGRRTGPYGCTARLPRRAPRAVPALAPRPHGPPLSASRGHAGPPRRRLRCSPFVPYIAESVRAPGPRPRASP